MTVIIAHRGDPVGFRENTLEAFGSAVALGAEMVELDCKLTRDGQVVVVHDDTLERLWGVPAAVRDVDWQILRAIRSEGYRVPSLAEALDAIPVSVMVDVASTVVIDAAYGVVLSAGRLDTVIFAGETAALARVHQLSPTARIALTWDRPTPPDPHLLESLAPVWFNPYFRLAAPAVVRSHHDAGRGVSVWTVDEPKDMAIMLETGVDAIISNQVARLTDIVRERSRREAPGAQS